MRKAYIFLQAMVYILLLSSVVYAQTKADIQANMIALWKFENNLIDVQGDHNWTDQGVDYTSTNCILGSCAVFDNGGFVNQSDTYIWSNLTNFSWSFWGKLNNSGSYFISYGRNNAQPYWGNHLRLFQSINVSWFAGRTGGTGFYYLQTFDLTIPNINSSWHFYTINIDTGNRNATLYIDDAVGSNISTYTVDAGNVKYNDSWQNMKLMGDISSATTVEGHIDELMFLNRTITAAEHNLMWNNGNGLDMEVGAGGGFVTVDLISPPDDNTNNSAYMNFTYNVSSGDNISNCSLWTNSTGLWALNTTNQSIIVNASYNNITNVEFADGTYLWNVQCYNSTGYAFDTNNYTFSIDTVSPTIETNFTNHSNAYNTLIGQFNFSDNNLIHTVNITTENIICFNETNISSSTFQHNLTCDITSLGVGNHSLSVSVADGGTGKALGGDYGVDIGVLFHNVLQYNFYDDGYIKSYIKGGTTSDVWTSDKKTDRYTQTLVPDNPSDTITIVEESDQYIYIYRNKGHHGDVWIVMGNHWKDYILEGEPEAKISKIERITPNKVEVTITGIKNNPGLLRFSSVGDLNVVVKNYTYTKVNVSEIYSDPIINDLLTSLYLDIIGNGSSPTNVKLEWNGTNYTASEIINNATLIRYERNITPSISMNDTFRATNVSHRWFFDFVGTEENTNFTNQTLYQIVLDNCSNANTHTINYSFRDENNDSLVYSDVSGYYYYGNGSGTERTYTLDMDNIINYSMCLYPPQIVLTGNYNISYEASEYPLRRYSNTGFIFTNSTQTKTLYLLHQDDGITIYFRVVNAASSPLSGATITAQTVIDGTLTTVEIELTDDSGLATFFLDPDKDYTITASRDGYETATFTLRPTTSEIITITLSSTGDVEEFVPPYVGISYYFTPTNSVLENETDTNFSFTLTSSGYRDITLCNLTIMNSTATLSSAVGTFNSTYCYASLIYNTGLQTDLISYAQFQLNNTINLTQSKTYKVRYTYEGTFSLKNFIDDLTSFGSSGFNDTTRMILALICIIAIMSAASMNYEAIRDPEVFLLLLWGLVFFFSYIGWFTLSGANIPSVRGFDLEKWIIFIVISLGIGSYFVRKELL